MLSRDTRVHVTVIIAAMALFLAIAGFTDVRGPSAVLIAIAFNAVAYGGAHAYLLWRGDDGLVPVASRHRFVVLVATIAILSAMGSVLDVSSTILGFELWTFLVVGGVGALVCYWILEARAGYRSSRRTKA